MKRCPANDAYQGHLAGESDSRPLCRERHERSAQARVEWESSDPDILSVDARGWVRALAAGEATIYAIFRGVRGMSDARGIAGARIVMSPDTARICGEVGSTPPPPFLVKICTTPLLAREP